MVTIVLSLFVLTAVLGLVVSVSILKRKKTNKPVVIAHGAVGAVGLASLAYYTFRNPDNLAIASVALFALAAIGGFYLFANDMRGKPGPVPLVVVHAALAVSGLVLATLVFMRVGE